MLWSGAVDGAVEPLTDINIYDTILYVGDNSHSSPVEIPQREKTMAEFEVNLGDTTVSIDDDGLYDAIEYKVDSAIENYISSNLDVSDDVYHVIWDFNRWDEIISSNMQYISVNDLDDGHRLVREDDLGGAIETLLEDFLRVAAGGRCGVGKAFADATKRVIGEVLGGIEEHPDAFTSNFEPMIRKVVHEELAGTMMNGGIEFTVKLDENIAKEIKHQVAQEVLEGFHEVLTTLEARAIRGNSTDND